MSETIQQVPIRLKTGETWNLNFKDGQYCCPVCGHLSARDVEPPFSMFPGEIEGTWDLSSSYSICGDCMTEYGLDLSIMGMTLDEVEENVLALRLTWLCQSGWPANGLARLRAYLGVSDELIREYERLTGRAHGLDQRFRPRKLGRKKRKNLPQQPNSVTCPCCGHLGAITSLFNFCGFCGWRYVPEQELSPDSSHPMNPVTFRVAQKNYTLFGAITSELGAVIHKPEYDLGIDPEWRPLSL